MIRCVIDAEVAQVETTAPFAHLSRDSVRVAAERIAVSIATDIL